MTIKVIDDLSMIITDKKNDNNYSKFEVIENSHGVYIFQKKDSEEIIYIGEAKEQTLKNRIIQNFKAKDTGGTFKKTYEKENECNFEKFSNYIKELRIIVIECPPNIIIRALESILINVLSPKYNKDK